MFPGAPTPPNITGGAGGGSRSGDAASKLTGSQSFDASGWTVATGNARASSSAFNPYLIAGLAAAAAFIVWRLTK